MSDNPYQATKLTEVSSQASDANPTLDGAVNMLNQTKPWVRFISVMMFIGSGFMVLGGLFIMISGTIGAGQAPGAMATGIGAVIGGVYIVMAMFYIIPAVFLWRYADRIALFVLERSNSALVSALEAQKSFWKFVGILMLVVMAIYALIIVIAVIGGVIASM